MKVPGPLRAVYSVRQLCRRVLFQGVLGWRGCWHLRMDGDAKD